MDSKLKKELHKIALKNNLRDKDAKKLVESPFEFMKKIIENLDLENLNKVNFYHKGLGRFYLKEDVLKKINELNNKKNDNNSK